MSKSPIVKPKVTTIQQPTIFALYLRKIKSYLTVRQNFYVLGSLLILIATTIYWALLGARLQQSNSDQLVDPQLFDSYSVFHNALIPAAHTFLIKWPLFCLIKIFGFNQAAYIGVTVSIVLATILAFVYLIYKIEKRQAIFSLLCLGISSVLLMVPSQPYAGGLLPVNMAMLATRNIEYILFIFSLILLVKSTGFKSKSFWFAVVTLGLLGASDKLFLAFALGSALIGLVIYSLCKKWDFANLASSWFVMAVLATILSLLIISAIKASGLTHIVSAGTGVPYTVDHSGKDIALGTLYGVLGIFTNFGANPAYDATIVKNIPHSIVHGLFNLAGPAYLINFLIMIFCILSAVSLIITSFSKKSRRLTKDVSSRYALVMIWVAVGALILFIASSHYYAVDSRYLGIVFFSLFIAAALNTRAKKWSPVFIRTATIILLVSIVFGIISSLNTFHKQSSALAATGNRDHLIAQALDRHHVRTLLGDYWRVLPIKEYSGNKVAVTPLESCSVARSTLTSKSWEINLKTNSFAYLLSFDKSLSDYPSCNIQGVINTYGRPNSSILIEGSLAHPKEVLMIYDHGVNHAPAANKRKSPATILPIGLDDLLGTKCNNPTVMSFVAHEDDDLLFMNPDLIKAIQDKKCIRTVYLTAGDAGGGSYYWLGREQGSEAAYAEMLGKKVSWVNRIIKVSDNEYISVVSPRDNSNISLIFVHLPDGGLKGHGFNATKHETLGSLQYGSIKQIHSVDNQSVYTSNDLINTLAVLMHTYQPTEIRTQADYLGTRFTDHPDHMTVGRFVKSAYEKYDLEQFAGEVKIPLKFYIGYPIHEMPENVYDRELKAKEDAFFAYSKYDSGACDSFQMCSTQSVYGEYLTRQYLTSD